MKPMIVFAIALVAGVGAGTGAKVMTTPPPVAVTDSTKADSTHAEGALAEGDGGEAAAHVVKDPTAPGDTAAVASGGAAKPPADAHGAPTMPAVATASNKAIVLAALEARIDSARRAAAKAPVDTATQAAERRVAKVFTSMDAKAAAKVTGCDGSRAIAAPMRRPPRAISAS